MATKAATPTRNGGTGQEGPALYDVGELLSKHKVGRAVFAGVARQAGSPQKPSPRRSSSRRSRNLRTLLRAAPEEGGQE